MCTATSIATQSAVEEAVTKVIIVLITEVDFNLKTYQKFSCTVLNAVRAVPSTVDSGNNKHIYLLESVAVYIAHTGGTSYTKAVNPGTIYFTRATTNAQITGVKETRMTDLETYNTQEGVRAGLRKSIVAHMPGNILVELEDTESNLDEVEPRRLLETIKGHAAPVTCLDAMALKNARAYPRYCHQQVQNDDDVALRD